MIRLKNTFLHTHLKKTGLHLHGLNVRSKEFNTLPTELVDAFADEWGFIKTPTKVLKGIQEVKDFTKTCSDTGEWDGEPVEGFVVRAYVAETPTSSKDGPPYQPGSSFFLFQGCAMRWTHYGDYRGGF